MKKINLNFDSLQEDFRKIAISLFVAIIVGSILNGKPILGNLASLFITAIVWFLGLVELPTNNDKQQDYTGDEK